VIGIATKLPGNAALLKGQPDRIVEPAVADSTRRSTAASGVTASGCCSIRVRPWSATGFIARSRVPDLCQREPEYRRSRAVKAKLFRVAGVNPTGVGPDPPDPGRPRWKRCSGRQFDRVRLLVCRNGVYATASPQSPNAGHRGRVGEGGRHRADRPGGRGCALAADPAIDGRRVVHHETTTGLLNPSTRSPPWRRPATFGWRRRDQFARRGGAAAGRQRHRLRGGRTSNKCLHGLPGAAFVLLSSAARRGRPGRRGVSVPTFPATRSPAQVKAFRSRPRCRPSMGWRPRSTSSWTKAWINRHTEYRTSRLPRFAFERSARTDRRGGGSLSSDSKPEAAEGVDYERLTTRQARTATSFTPVSGRRPGRPSESHPPARSSWRSWRVSSSRSGARPGRSEARERRRALKAEAARAAQVMTGVRRLLRLQRRRRRGSTPRSGRGLRPRPEAGKQVPEPARGRPRWAGPRR